MGWSSSHDDAVEAEAFEASLGDFIRLPGVLIAGMVCSIAGRDIHILYVAFGSTRCCNRHSFGDGFHHFAGEIIYETNFSIFPGNK